MLVKQKPGWRDVELLHTAEHMALNRQAVLRLLQDAGMPCQTDRPMKAAAQRCLKATGRRGNRVWAAKKQA